MGTGKPMPMWFHDLYEVVQATQEMKAMYILAVLCVAMIMDVGLGTLAAIFSNETPPPKSRIGINGLIRKAASIVVLIFCAFLVPVIPYKTGIATLYVLYTGFLGFEMLSIVENLAKLGVDVTPLTRFLSNFTSVFTDKIGGK